MKKTIALALSILLTGCATPPQLFDLQKKSNSNAQICRTLATARSAGGDAFYAKVFDEASRRGYDESSCSTLVAAENQAMKNAAIGIVAVAGVVALAAAASRGGGGGGASAYGPTNDTDWAWDEFYNERYQLVWMCRGKQTGQFADAQRCAYKPQNDFTWPSKQANGR